MKMTVGELREVMRSAMGGSDPNEAYSADSIDDPLFNKDSKYVSRKRKKHIKKFLRDLGLAS